MPETIELEVATPERQLVHEHVGEVQLPGKNGYMGILPGHAALLGQLGTGFLTYVAGGKHRYVAVHGGFVEVVADHVRVLADTAERAEEIDLDRAKADLKQAEEQLGNPALGVDPAVALEAIAAAQARIEAAEKK
jgi:F-type H+-transporting ATPase subunit epsilon